MPSLISHTIHPAAPFCVLVADPDADTVALYRQSFALAGCDVVEASDGRDALTQALMRPPALIVTGLRLPLIDGFALCEILRRDRATENVPILVVTAEARPAELQRAHRAGADVVLVKPTTPDVLLTRARELLGRSTDVRVRSETTRATADDRFDKSIALLGGSPRRKPLAKVHHRQMTTTPPLTPPTLTCPSCDQALTYQFSQIGGVSARHAEQWDYFKCSSCGFLQYRQRTRKVRRLGKDEEQWVNALKT